MRIGLGDLSILVLDLIELFFQIINSLYDSLVIHLLGIVRQELVLQLGAINSEHQSLGICGVQLGNLLMEQGLLFND